MPNIVKIRNLPSASELTDGDYAAIDNSTDGLRKVPFGGIINGMKSELADLNKRMSIKDLQGKAICHRGFGWKSIKLPLVCQNTIKAFQLAIDNGYLGVETDVQKDADGVICCFHDVTVDELTDGNGYFKDYSYVSLHCKDGNGVVTAETPITLAQACDWASSNNAVLEIEIKTDNGGSAASVDEVVAIAEKYQTIIIINCQFNRALLNECQAKYPECWKSTTYYGSSTINTTLIDTLYNTGYTNLILHTKAENVVDYSAIKYAYEHGYLIMRYSNAYSDEGFRFDNGYSMTFGEDPGRPNFASPLIFDSGWVLVDDNEMLSNFKSVSDVNFKFGYRYINNMVYLKGIVQKNDWTALPKNNSTRAVLFTLPKCCRPDQFQRDIGNIGDALVGYHIISINPNTGSVIPCYSVSNNISLDDINSETYTVFMQFPAVNYKG